MTLSLFLFLFGTTWTTTRAGDPDVFPSEFIVPQCTELEAVWSQPHLHVQPGTSITTQNLVDLELQTGTSTTFRPPFDIGTNFTFAYNTIANQFLVFQSSLMQVGPGTTDCLPGAGNPPPPPPSSSASPAKNTNTVAVTSTTSGSESAAADPTPSRSSSNALSSLGSRTAQASPATSGLPITTSSSPASAADFTVSTASSSKTAAAFPVGPVVGSICALAVIILLGLALCWHWQRRSVRMLAALNSERTGADVEVHSSNFVQGPNMAEQAQLMALMHNRYGGAPQEHPKILRDRLMRNPSLSPTPTPNTVQDSDETNSEAFVEDLPPAYEDTRRPSRQTTIKNERLESDEAYTSQSTALFGIRKSHDLRALMILSVQNAIPSPLPLVPDLHTH
ncbi:hypothetical protein B0H13DRAFT_1876435 [Mycena leptocephala]|nr:hypothetical protein B0H13DRAFT_1876435 [Mycena leptocephala]